MENQEIVDRVFKNLAEGKAVTVQDVQGSLDMGRELYILGPTPSATRLAMRFFYQGSSRDILKHIERYYDRVETMHPTADAMEYLGMWHTLQETVNKKSRDEKPVPNMSGAVCKTVISSGRYSASLHQAVLGRIWAEQNDGDSWVYKITRGGAAIIRTYLLKSGNEKEEIIMTLSEDSSNTMHILGRKFAVLKVTQEDVNPGINATTKDKCFNSTCTTPTTVFPISFKLENNHIKRINNGTREMYYEKILGDLQGRLTIVEGQKATYPRRLTLEEQGMFILGYYHWIQKRCEKKIEEEA